MTAIKDFVFAVAISLLFLMIHLLLGDYDD